MKKKARQNKRDTVSRSPWRVVSMIVVCVLLFVAGFFYAGRQHFLSMDFGMKNSKLRKQIEQLESEKRRLILAKETSLSPAEIKKAAKKLGLLDPPAIDGQLAQAIPASSIEKPPIQAAKPVENTPLVIKTASVAGTAQPTAKTLVAKVEKTERGERTRFAESTPKPAKKTIASE